MSGNLRARRTRAAAWGLGLERPCSHFSGVRLSMRGLRAKAGREGEKKSKAALGFARGDGEENVNDGAENPTLPTDREGLIG